MDQAVRFWHPGFLNLDLDRGLFWRITDDISYCCNFYKWPRI